MDATSDAGVGRGLDERVHDRGTQRRRPSGEAPPLPHELGRSGKFFLLMVLYFTLVLAGFLIFPTLEGVFERLDHNRQIWITDLRTPGLTRVMLVVNGLTSSWTIRVLRWGVLLGLVVFRRWRHLFVFLGAIIAIEIITYNASIIIARPRPLGIAILTGWQGYSMPSRPLAGLAVSAVGAAYALIVPGRPRSVAKWVIGIALGTLVFVRVYLGVDHMTDAVMGSVFGVAVGVALFRWFAPNDLFPVSYRRGKAAHLDVGGRRGEAIVVGDQGPARAHRAGREAGRVWRGRAGRRRSGSGSARRSTNRSATSSPSCTRGATYGRTAGTSSDGRSCTARSRTSRRSSPSGDSSSTRTTRSA